MDQKRKRKYSLLTGSVIIFFIIITPYLLYFYKFINPEITETSTIFGTISAGSHQLIQYYAYYFFAKFVPFLLLIVWFLTNKHWWVHAILIPLSVYLFQMINIVGQSANMDEVEFIYTVPICAIIIVILYFVRSKMSIFIQAVDLKKEMDTNMNFSKKID